MTDREMLEMAAKAAGHPYMVDGDVWHEAHGGQMREWNPLTDDGDALRLAVALHLRTVFHPVLNQALVREYHDSTREWLENGEDHQDRYAAIRRAIVRAAAAIGVAMS